MVGFLLVPACPDSKFAFLLCGLTNDVVFVLRVCRQSLIGLWCRSPERRELPLRFKGCGWEWTLKGTVDTKSAEENRTRKGTLEARKGDHIFEPCSTVERSRYTDLVSLILKPRPL